MPITPGFPIVNGEFVKPDEARRPTVTPEDTLEQRVFKQSDRWEEIGKIQLHPDTKALLVEWQDAKELLAKRPNRSAAFNHFVCILEDKIREEIDELKALRAALDKHQQ